MKEDDKKFLIESLRNLRGSYAKERNDQKEAWATLIDWLTDYPVRDLYHE